ncbi:MAG: tetratricopeptide repeat protein [Anaerolineae bacterium]
METRLSRICDAIIEAGWLAALVVAPLFFNTFSNRVFEPDKIHLVRSIALLMTVAWGVQLLDGGLSQSAGLPSWWKRLQTTPLALPALILVLSYLLSTALSIVPRISLFGSYMRMQGALTFLSYVAIFAMVLTHLRRRAQVDRLLYTVVLTSLPIAIYGIIQKAGLDPLPWGGDVKERVAANMGNAIFVAAYLIIAFFLTLERLLDSLASLLDAERGTLGDALRAGSYMFVLAVQAIAIVYTQSRGPWLGWGAGLYVFGMLGLLLLGRWAAGRLRVPAVLRWLSRHVKAAWLGLIGIALAVIALVVTLNVSGGPLQGLCEKRYVSRVCTLFSTSEGTNAVRVLIWEGVVDLMFKPHGPIEHPDGTPDRLNVIRPLIGYGPESMWVAYNRFYPPELAHYEARNASPDRSHNETFDALVRGGLLQFGTQLVLFSSIFYYALRWLGLVRGEGRRKLFVAMLVGGGVAGVIVPLLADGSLRLAGIGLPAGLIAGMIIYVTLDLFLGSPQTGAEEPPVVQARAGRRQLLILALLSAIVAHFVEVHFGIAIVSTLTYLWTLMAVLVVVGMQWDGEGEHTVPIAANAPSSTANKPFKKAPDVATTPQPAKAGLTRSAESQRKSTKQSRKRQEEKRPTPPAHSTTAPRTSLGPFLPYLGSAGLITLVLVWNYLVNQAGATSSLVILRQAFTTRLDNYRIVSSPGILILMLIVWLVGGLLAIAGARLQAGVGRRGGSLTAALLYALTVVGIFLGFGLIQASRLTLAGLSGLDIFRHIANNIVVFDLCLLLIIGGLALTIALSELYQRPVQAFARRPLLSLTGGALLAALAFAIIVNVNIQTVQADTLYKQGLPYESAGQWEGAAVLYREAVRLEPQEDYYYLFLGRSLLQLATAAPAKSTPVLPENLDGIATADLLSLVERSLQTRNREDLYRAAYAALVAAQRLNPLNTDHSANLARLQRAWAFAASPDAAGGQATILRLRELSKAQTGAVNIGRLEQAVKHYRQALALSPQNAGLWNELALVQLILDDLEGARTSLERSLALDSRFYLTHLYHGDLFDLMGDKQAALAAYRRAAELAPNDLNVLKMVGVFSAQNGDTQSAVEAFQHIIEIETEALRATENRLAQLTVAPPQAGGYRNLEQTAAQMRVSLQNQLTMHRAEVHLGYRNLALVLRDAGRINEALQAARQAAVYANAENQAVIETLIADLQKRLTP